MALPATGSTITMSDIRNFFLFEGEASSYTLGILGTYIGIAQGNTISMSASFGGRENTQGAFFLLNEYTGAAGSPEGQLSGSIISICLDTWPGQTGSNLGVMFALGGNYTTGGDKVAGLIKCADGGTITTFTKLSGKWIQTNPSMYAINGTKYLIMTKSLSGSSSTTLHTFNSSGTQTSSFDLGWNVSRPGYMYSKANDRFYAMDVFDSAGTGRGTIKRYTLTGTNDANISFPTPTIGSGSVSYVDVRERAQCIVPGMDAMIISGYMTRGGSQYTYVYMFDCATDTWYKLVEGPVSDSSIPGISSTASIYSSGVVMSHDRRYIAVEFDYTGTANGSTFYRCYQKTDGDWTTLTAPLVKEGDQLWDSALFDKNNNYKILDPFYGPNGGVFVSSHYQGYDNFIGVTPGVGRTIDFETGSTVAELYATGVSEWANGANSKFPNIQSQRDITTTNEIKNVGGTYYQYGYAASREPSSDARVRYEMIIPLPNT